MKQNIIVAGAFAACVCLIEMLFPEYRASALHFIGLTGLGKFIWIYVAGVFFIEVKRHQFLEKLNLIENARHPNRMELEYLVNEMSDFFELAKEVLSNLGLAGTIIGLMAALSSMATSMNSGVSKSPVSNELATAFATTLSSCYVIMIVLGITYFLKLRTDKLLRRVRGRFNGVNYA